jgi:beta-phosphoglucomutase-like phosphatase (HAD superfamily)
MIKGVIFDMDGTMVDTETLWRDVTIKLAERADYADTFAKNSRTPVFIVVSAERI